MTTATNPAPTVAAPAGDQTHDASGAPAPAGQPSHTGRTSRTVGIEPSDILRFRRVRDRPLGIYLRQHRHALNLTQADVCATAGVGASMLSKIERGERRPSLAAFLNLCNALDLTPADVLDELQAADGDEGPGTLLHNLTTLQATAPPTTWPHTYTCHDCGVAAVSRTRAGLAPLRTAHAACAVTRQTRPHTTTDTTPDTTPGTGAPEAGRRRPRVSAPPLVPVGPGDAARAARYATTDPTVLAQRFREARQSLGLQQSELAARIGTSNTGISLIENARTTPSYSRFLLLCQALDLDPDITLAGPDVWASSHANVATPHSLNTTPSTTPDELTDPTPLYTEELAPGT